MLKIIIIALIGALIISYLKSVGSEYVSLAVTATGIILSFFALSYLEEIYGFFSEIFFATGIDSDMYKIIFKITSIGYITEFAAGSIEDLGLKGLADKLVFVGKIIILSVSIPVFKAVIDLIVGIMK